MRLGHQVSAVIFISLLALTGVGIAQSMDDGDPSIDASSTTTTTTSPSGDTQSTTTVTAPASGEAQVQTTVTTPTDASGVTSSSTTVTAPVGNAPASTTTTVTVPDSNATATVTSIDKKPDYIKFLNDAGVTYVQTGSNFDVTIDGKLALLAIPKLAAEGIVSKVEQKDIDASPYTMSGAVVGVSFTAVIVHGAYSSDPTLDKIHVNGYLIPPTGGEKQLCFSFDFNRATHDQLNWETLTPKDFISKAQNFSFSPWCNDQMNLEAKALPMPASTTVVAPVSATVTTVPPASAGATVTTVPPDTTVVTTPTSTTTTTTTTP